jgi:hypothetical protein
MGEFDRPAFIFQPGVGFYFAGFLAHPEAHRGREALPGKEGLQHQRLAQAAHGMEVIAGCQEHKVLMAEEALPFLAWRAPRSMGRPVVDYFLNVEEGAQP